MPNCQVLWTICSRPNGAAVLPVEAPPHAGLAHPAGDRVEVVVGEPEPRAHRRRLGEVEHLAGRWRGRRRGRAAAAATPSSGLVWVSARSASRDPQPVRRVTAGHDLTEAEAGRDQRRVGLDVGAHHEDVARLEGRVVLEQAEQHLAQHVDLAGRAVAAVHLHRAVVVRQHPALRRRTALARRSAWSQPSSVSGGAAPRWWWSTVSSGGEAALELAQVAAQGRQQRVADAPVADGRRAAAPAPRASASACH